MFKAIATAAVLVSLAAPAFAADVQMMRVLPGQTYDSPMPAEPLFSKIAKRVDNGEFYYTTLSASKLKKACGVRYDVLGCVVNLRGLKAMYLWDGLKGKAKRLTIIHEAAHSEYDWDHE